jgi:malto-oligosyltrehalose synthase
VARQRFGQLSATLTAKAVEDTAFYRYGRLLSRNEVGADPGRLAISSKEFHEYNARRYRDFPTAMLATATHDHKRGEDQRARLAVLSEIPAEWAAFVAQWFGRFDLPRRVQLTLYQGLVGAWPLELQVEDEAGLERFKDRLTQWLVKALREAKEITSWDDSDESFEFSCVNFLADLLADKDGFLRVARAFAERIAPAGALNGLAQTMLRLTVPGVPDLYQGTEFWDFSLVDPDNRTAVDFEVRRHALGDDIQRPEILGHGWRDGRVKQAVIARLLRFRGRYPQLFMKGTYEPLAIIGPKSNHLLGFVRRFGDTSILVLVSRFAGRFIGTGDAPILPISFWQETRVELPEGFRAGRMVDLLCGRTRVAQTTMTADQFLDHLPVAVVQMVK